FRFCRQAHYESPTLESLDHLMNCLATASMAQLLREPARVCLGFKPRNANDQKEQVIPLAVIPPVGLVPFFLRTFFQPVLQPIKHLTIRNTLTPGPPRITPVCSAVVSIRNHKVGKLTVG